MKTNVVQIITDAKGAPAFAVVPWIEYQRLTSKGDEDAELIAAATPHRGEEAFPADVARRLLAGEVPLKVFREWRGLTQEKLEEMSGVASQYISQIERRDRGIGRITGRKLAPVLGVSLEALLDDVEVTEPDFTSFRKFILTCRAPDSPMGDFVKDARADRNLPDAKTWKELQTYLVKRHAAPAATKAAKSVWIIYNSADKKSVAKDATPAPGRAR